MNAGYVPGLFKLQDLVKVPPAVRTDMYIRQATPATYRQVLREIRQKEIFKLIVDTNPRHMYHFFRAVSNGNFPRSSIRNTFCKTTTQLVNHSQLTKKLKAVPK
jgi:hypothetical protein